MAEATRNFYYEDDGAGTVVRTQIIDGTPTVQDKATWEAAHPNPPTLSDAE